jgi:hypothetical protein
MVRGTLPVRCNQCGPARGDCKPRINTVGSGAMNVGRTHAPESMIVGSCALPTKKESRCPRPSANGPPDPQGSAKYHRSRRHVLACAFAPQASGKPSSDREDSVHDPTIFHPVGCRASLHGAFGEDCQKAFVILAVMQLGHLLAIAPITFFNSMR